MIVPATISDLHQIHQLTQSCAKNLVEQHIFQWNEAYPSIAVLQNDINLNQLWKLQINSTIIGIIVLTEIEDNEYTTVQWLTHNCKNLYVHRLAVHPSFQNKGYASELMNFAENYAKHQGYCSIRLDTFSKNPKNLKFYKKRKYQQLEAIYFPKQSIYPFYCFERILNE
jgi:GNAT superfamily N-acetyltransferase